MLVLQQKIREEKFFPKREREGRRRVFFLVRSLEEERDLLSDFFFFRMKIKLDLIFNIKI